MTQAVPALSARNRHQAANISRRALIKVHRHHVLVSSLVAVNFSEDGGGCWLKGPQRWFAAPSTSSCRVHPHEGAETTRTRSIGGRVRTRHPGVAVKTTDATSTGEEGAAVTHPTATEEKLGCAHAHRNRAAAETIRGHSHRRGRHATAKITRTRAHHRRAVGSLLWVKRWTSSGACGPTYVHTVPRHNRAQNHAIGAALDAARRGASVSSATVSRAAAGTSHCMTSKSIKNRSGRQGPSYRSTASTRY